MFLGAGLLILSSMVYAAVPQLINFQGILRDSSGDPVADGSYSVVFTIYDAPAGGANQWSETQSVNTTNGLFAIELGANTPLTAAVFPSGADRYLGITVGSDPEVSPRTHLNSVAYAYLADNAAIANLAQDLTCTGCVGTGDIDATQVQQRVSGTAPAGQYITAINQDGSVATAPAGFGKIVNFFVHQNAARTSLPTGASITLESFLYDKKSPTSFLVIQGTISGFGAHAGSMMQGWKLGTSAEALAQSIPYTGQMHSIVGQTAAVISGHSTTGVQVMTFRYFTQDASPGSRPFNFYNPNGTDDSRLAQTRSVYLIWEMEP